MDNLPMPHGELLTLWTHNFGKISFPKKGDNKEIYRDGPVLPCNLKLSALKK